MKHRLTILIISLLILMNLAEINIEKNLISYKNKKQFKQTNALLYYSISKITDDNKKQKALAGTFFKLNPHLYFIIVRKNEKTVLIANRDAQYNKLLNGFLSMLKKKPIIADGFHFKISSREKFYFSSNGQKTLKIITGHYTQFNLPLLIGRNLILSLIILGIFLLFHYKNLFIKSQPPIDKEEPLKEEVPEEQERIQEQISDENLYTSNLENYKNLYEDNQKLVEELENLSTFREVGLAINSILNFNQMLHAIMGVVIGKMSVKKIIIYFIDDDNKELKGKIGREHNKIIPEENLIDDNILIGAGPLGRAMELHTPIIFSDNTNENFLICPLIAKGNLIGAIKISTKLDHESFNEKDTELLKLLSSQIAIALNNARLYELAITDGLTKLYVHRHFQYKMQEETLRHKRNGKTLSLIMLDIDHFKSLNDNHGHQTGDMVLRTIAQIIKNMFRATDSTFRYGGEEMAVILPETNSDNAYILAEKLRTTIESHQFQTQTDQLNITVSLGVSTYLPEQMGVTSKEELIKMADDALYFSKNNGRNKTTLYGHINKQQSSSDQVYTEMNV